LPYPPADHRHHDGGGAIIIAAKGILSPSRLAISPVRRGEIRIVLGGIR
jgi:hypothetical protein